MPQKKAILLTRPQERLADLSSNLKNSGFSVIYAPMLRIEPLQRPLPDAQSYDALVFTSISGIEAAAPLKPPRDKPVFAIGEASAAAAKHYGFDRVHSGKGDGADLAALIRNSLAPGARLLHLCGQERTLKIDVLENEGFAVIPHPVYRAVPAADMPGEAVLAFENGGLDAVLFFSVRTAANLVKIIQRKGLDGKCASIRALCLSPDVGQAAGLSLWKTVEIAPQPDQKSILSLLN